MTMHSSLEGDNGGMTARPSPVNKDGGMAARPSPAEKNGVVLVKPPCRRCLLEDLPSGSVLAANIRDLIAQLPPECRTPAQEEKERLDTCRSCEHLSEGMCALCGCYVELRAARNKSRCPDLPDRWPKKAE